RILVTRPVTGEVTRETRKSSNVTLPEVTIAPPTFSSATGATTIFASAICCALTQASPGGGCGAAGSAACEPHPAARAATAAAATAASFHFAIANPLRLRSPTETPRSNNLSDPEDTRHWWKYIVAGRREIPAATRRLCGIAARPGRARA